MLSGKYVWIWNWDRSSDGNPYVVARQLIAAGCRGCLIKSDDGGHPFGLTWDVGRTKEVIRILRYEGLEVLCWGYIYGRAGTIYGDQKFGVQAEADMAIRALTEFQIDGYVVDAEIEFERLPNPLATAQSYFRRIRDKVPRAELYYSPFAQPSYHQKFPYDEFSRQCKAAFPMAYSGSMFPVGTPYYRPDRGEEAARRSHLDWVLSGLPESMWQPAADAVSIAPHSTTPHELKAFAELAIVYGATTLSWWVYEYIDRRLWAAITDVDLGGGTVPDIEKLERQLANCVLNSFATSFRDSAIRDLMTGELTVGVVGPNDLRRVLKRSDGSVVGTIDR